MANRQQNSLAKLKAEHILKLFSKDNISLLLYVLLARVKWKERKKEKKKKERKKKERKKERKKEKRKKERKKKERKNKERKKERKKENDGNDVKISHQSFRLCQFSSIQTLIANINHFLTLTSKSLNSFQLKRIYSLVL